VFPDAKYGEAVCGASALRKRQTAFDEEIRGNSAAGKMAHLPKVVTLRALVEEDFRFTISGHGQK